MLINPGAQQRVAGFEAQEEGGKKARKEWRNFCFVLFSVSLWQFFPFPCESLGGAREESEWRGCWRGWNRVSSWVCVPVKVCPSPWEEVGRRSPDLPQVALDMEISSKIEHKMVFIAFSSPKKKKERISFHSFWLLAEMVFSVLARNTQSTVSWWKVPLVVRRAILPEPKEYAVLVKLFC